MRRRGDKPVDQADRDVASILGVSPTLFAEPSRGAGLPGWALFFLLVAMLASIGIVARISTLILTAAPRTATQPSARTEEQLSVLLDAPAPSLAPTAAGPATPKALLQIERPRPLEAAATLHRGKGRLRQGNRWTARGDPKRRQALAMARRGTTGSGRSPRQSRGLTARVPPFSERDGVGTTPFEEARQAHVRAERLEAADAIRQLRQR